MKTIAVAMAKGGSGRSTISAALAVRAAKDFSKVAMVDLNKDQASLTQWASLRDLPGSPQLHDFDDSTIAEELPRLAAEGWDICVLDTPPSYYNVIETAIMVADAVIVPVKTSIHDAGTLDTVVEMCRKYDKPFTVVLSDVDSRFKSINTAVAASLRADRLPLLELRIEDKVQFGISHLASYQAAPNEGKTGPEIDPRAAQEIEVLWQEAVRLAGIAVAKHAPSKRRQERRTHG